jgi:hypothetical protein
VVSTDEELRALFDERGLLREGALASPSAEDALVVFAQARDARFDADRWDAQAARFFDARVGLTIEKRYVGAPPCVDAARVVIAVGRAEAEQNGVRLVFGRPRNDEDLAKAVAIEARRGGGGLADLAKRCDQVWLIERESPDDALALRLAAILASVALGPIVDLANDTVFGVRGARERF